MVDLLSTDSEVANKHGSNETVDLWVNHRGDSVISQSRSEEIFDPECQ